MRHITVYTVPSRVRARVRPPIALAYSTFCKDALRILHFTNCTTRYLDGRARALTILCASALRAVAACKYKAYVLSFGMERRGAKLVPICGGLACLDN